LYGHQVTPINWQIFCHASISTDHGTSIGRILALTTVRR
jgi:hypothetical protein